MENNHPEAEHSFDEAYREKQDMFGHPYQELQDYFKKYPLKGKVLDIGCGQGRDAIFLASLGYTVTAVDNSKIGVGQMLIKAKEQRLEIKGIVADVLNLNLTEKFDIILFDMILHAFEEQQQQELLQTYSTLLNQKGIMCIVFPDDMSSSHFMEMLQPSFNLVDEIIIHDVPKLEGEKSDFTFTMIIVQSASDL